MRLLMLMCADVQVGVRVRGEPDLGDDAPQQLHCAQALRIRAPIPPHPLHLPKGWYAQYIFPPFESGAFECSSVEELLGYPVESQGEIPILGVPGWVPLREM